MVMSIALIMLAIFSSIGIGIFFISKEISAFQAPILTFSFIIFILYFFGLFNILQFGIFSIYVLGIYSFIKNFKFITQKICKQKYNPQALFFGLYTIPFIVAMLAIDSDYMLTNWDEFSIWGPNIKYMNLYNQLYSYANLSYINYKNYPPAQELYQYFYMYGNEFSERKLISLEIIIVLLTLVSIFYPHRQSYLYGGLGFILSTTIIYFFHLNFNTIYVDTLLAFYFAATVFFIIQIKEKLIDHLCVFLMLFTMVQIKSVGLFLSLVSLAIYFIVVVVSNIKIDMVAVTFKRPGHPLFKNISGNKNIPYGYLLFAFLAVISSFISWSIFNSSLGVEIYPANPALIQFFQPPLANKFITITHAFLIRLQESSFTFHMRFHFLILTLLFAGICIPIIFGKQKKIRDAIIFLIFGIGFIGYLLFLLYLYLVRFSEYEGIRLAGFERYTATYLIAWVLVLLAYITINIEKRVILRLMYVAFVSFIFISPPPYFYSSVSHFLPGINEYDARLRINELLIPIKRIPKNEKIYYISQNASGLDSRIFQYSVLPRVVSTTCSSLGLPYGIEDTYTCNQKLEEVITEYNFIAIYMADEQFWKNNDYLFDKNSRGLLYGVFQVERNTNRVVIKKFGS